jgi:MFS family permease
MSVSDLSAKLQRLALINVCLGQFMTALDSRSIIVALPTISIHFNSSMAVVQWIPLAYQLTIIGFVLSLARLGDIRGRKKNLRIRISAACARLCVFGSKHRLMANNRVQGISRGWRGYGLGQWQGHPVDCLCTTGERPSLGTGLDGVSFGLYQRPFGCRSSHRYGGLALDFFLNLPVALAAAYMAWKVLPETPLQRQVHALDLPGMLTLFATAVTLILGLQQIAKSGVTWLSVVIFTISIGSAVLLLHFENKSPAPLLDLSLFKIRVLTAGVLSHLFVVISHSSTFFLLPFYLQGILHFSPTQVGVTVIFFSLVIVFLAPLGGWLGDRLGSRLLCTIGSALSLISMLGFSRLGADSGYIAVMIPLMILGVGWSIFQAPNLSAIFSAVEPRYVGAVSGISLTSANIANAMGVAVASVLFLRWLNHYGLDQSGVPPYTQWGENPAVFIRAFHNSWLIIAGLTVIAIVASSMRGVDKRQGQGS